MKTFASLGLLTALCAGSVLLYVRAGGYSFIQIILPDIPLNQLGSTDDCGFSPFADEVSTAREISFEKIRVRVEGTRLAGDRVGNGYFLLASKLNYATYRI